MKSATSKLKRNCDIVGSSRMQLKDILFSRNTKEEKQMTAARNHYLAENYNPSLGFSPRHLPIYNPASQW